MCDRDRTRRINKPDLTTTPRLVKGLILDSAAAYVRVLTLGQWHDAAMVPDVVPASGATEPL